MEALLYFTLWGLFIFLIVRFSHGFQVMGQRQGHGLAGSDAEPGLRWIPPAKDVDPVCKKTISTSAAKPSVFAGHVYYFCCRECREVFEAAPDLYIHDGSQPKLEHSHA